MATSTARSVFQAVSDPTRRAILDLLAGGEKTAGDLVAPFPISQPAVSQHLRVLREADLVRERRDGRRRIYRLNPAGLREVYDWAAHYERFWSGKLDALGAWLDADAAEETT